MIDLTAKQRDVLAFLRTWIQTHGFAPSTRQICERFHWKSTNAAIDVLDALERKGAIRRTPRVARSIVLVDVEQLQRAQRAKGRAA